MCGIVGIIRQGMENPEREVEACLSKLVHRGPDDTGTWSQACDHPFTVGLGHVRLSILDLSARGRQPMEANDGRVIVFNGEIYNYLELKKELKSFGHEFTTGTDTEVILAAHRQWGIDCVQHFVGMWAFAIWDGTSLFLSRDRLGKKPLYLYHNSHTGLLVFASEIKALKHIPGVPWEPDERMVFRYLALGETERNGHTFYRDIKELPAASTLLFTPKTNRLESWPYWSLPNEEIDPYENEAINKTAELLFESLCLRLRSDAPLGLSLSGGLDSTLLLALMKEGGIGSPSVFSSVYNEPGYNEARYFDLAVRHFGPKPYKTLSNARSFCHDVESLIYHLDQPSKLPGPYSQWKLAELAGKHVKVLIDGQGADELAGGYMYYLPVAWREWKPQYRLRYLPDLLRTVWANRHTLHQYPWPLIRERISGRATAHDDLPLNKKWATRFIDETPAWEEFTDLNTMLRQSVVDTSLPPLLRYGDRVNMAFGVENRCPFLDHRLVSYISSLPSEMKVRGGQTKWILRAVAKHKIPGSILNRRMKMGFPTPFGAWLCNELYQSVFQSFLDCRDLGPFNRWVDVDIVFRLLDEHAARKADYQVVLWRLLSVGTWLKIMELQ